MEVTLRKTKITASILKQMEIANEGQIFTYKVLGYFMIKTKTGMAPRVLLQNYDNEDCKLCIVAKSYKTSKPDDANLCFLEIDGIKSIAIYSDLFVDYAKSLGDRFIEIARQANKAGQIFY